MITIYDNMSLVELEQHIRASHAVYTRLKQEDDRMKEIERRKKRIQDADNKKRLETESNRIFDEELEVGDLVRVEGTRNPRYKWRLVTDINRERGLFTGWQYGPVKWRFEKTPGESGWVKGGEHTTHMYNKIRQIIKQPKL